MDKFRKHKKEWFTNRVGKMVIREHSIQTPANVLMSVKPMSTFTISSYQHALGCFQYHVDNKINFLEAK